jgi:hypothetical protein
MADVIKCGPHGGKKSETKSCMVPWLSLKAKTKSGRTWQPIHEWDWHGGHTKSARFAMVHHKSTGCLVEPQSQDQSAVDNTRPV